MSGRLVAAAHRKPASSRATATVATVERFPRSWVRCRLHEALRQLNPGQELTMITLRTLAKADRSIPSPGIVQSVGGRHGETFGSLRDKALREREALQRVSRGRFCK